MKKADIQIGKTYHNGKQRRTERKVIGFNNKYVHFDTVKGMLAFGEDEGFRGQIELDSFASWAKGEVERED